MGHQFGHQFWLDAPSEMPCHASGAKNIQSLVGAASRDLLLVGNGYRAIGIDMTIYLGMLSQMSFPVFVVAFEDIYYIDTSGRKM